ncbi:MAG TPA: DUF222 domain-containing protein [Candidatus Dormibacteraeota bacterium]|nr:DUF222 domain-containing protein [Candidatus Dormibacteraeota bacterium]
MNSQLPTARDAATLELAREMCELAAHLHAGTARLARLAAEFDRAEGWSGDGMRSCAQWLSINTGHGLAAGESLVRIGYALERLPLIAEAFASGELSLDKVRQLCTVATPTDEEVWLELARQASGAQLTRIVRACRRCIEQSDPDQPAAQRARRGLWTSWDDDGTLRLRAVLTPEDGARVHAALESVRRTLPDPSTSSGDPADDRDAAHRADALVVMCDRALAGEDAGERPVVVPQLVVHVDAGVLTGADPGGRCHLDGGPWLPAEVARRIGCDTEVIAITERDGIPIDVGRARRTVSTALRRALHVRDGFCRVPGCPVPARYTHAHHVEHWIDGGPTTLDNMACVCGPHHRRLHDGVIRIRRGADGELRFETADGRQLVVRSEGLGADEREPVALRCRLAGETAYRLTASAPCAGDAGGSFDLDHTVEVVVNACERRWERDGPDG